MGDKNSKVSVKGLRKSFGHLEVLKGMDVEISEGEVVCLIGPSGSGKSTFLRCLNALEAITAGTVVIDGFDLTDKKKININKVRENIGMVFQHFNLFANLNVIQNIMLAPVELKKMTKGEARARGMELLEMVGLAEKAEVFPSKLSGGQKQRVAIARALANNPTILLADEPTGALDQQTGRQVMNLFHDLNEEGNTIIMITHDISIARHAKRIVRLLDGELSEGVAEDA